MLVAGPSGCGKSTLLQQLKQGTLAPEVAALLPEYAASAAVIEANNLLKRDLSAQEYAQALADSRGCLLHYDTVFIHSHGLKRYADDPALAPLAALTRLHVVYVRPSAAMLQEQFLRRKARHESAKPPGSRWWARHVRLPLRRLKAALAGRNAPSTAELYHDPGWIASTCYPQWEDFLRQLHRDSRDMRLVVVSPATAPAAPPAFRVLDSASLGLPHTCDTPRCTEAPGR